MAERSNHMQAPDAADVIGEILSVLTSEEPHGASAAHIARALSGGPDEDVVQEVLEELVMRGAVDRRGIGRGAVYTRGAGA